MRDSQRAILVVDDNELLSGSLSQILSERGFVVRTASDGFEALASMRIEMPDVVISDLHMPGMSGFELLSVIRVRFPKVLAVAMSGAYPGSSVPPGIPADAYYAKGGGSVKHLLDLLNDLLGGEKWLGARSEAPMWIQWLPKYQKVDQTVHVVCAQCLRSSNHPPFMPGSCRTLTCGHCGVASQIILVGVADLVDRTIFSSLTR